MNYTVTIDNISAVEAIAIKHTLTDEWQLIDGRDFDWYWYPTTLDDTGWLVARPQHAEFRFCDEARATFFQLKYVK